MGLQAIAYQRASAPSSAVFAMAVAAASLLIVGASCAHPATRPAPPQVAVTSASTNLVDGAPVAGLVDGAQSPVHPLPLALGTTAVRVDTGRLDVGTFAVAMPPSPEHAKGTLAAVGWEYPSEAVRDSWSHDHAIAGTLYVVEIDLATATEIGRLPIGAAVPAEILRTESGLVVAVVDAHALTLVWLDGARSVRRVDVAAGLGSDSGFDMTGFAAMANRLVVVDGGNNGRATTAVVLDDHGGLVARHACRGGLPSPSPPTGIEWWGNRAVLTELTSENAKILCAFGLERGAHTREASFPAGSEVFVESGALYVGAFDSAGGERVRRVGDDLRAVAPVLADPRPQGSRTAPRCTGITGTAVWQQSLVEGLQVSRTISCCGDSAPAGIFVCEPNGGP